MEQEKDDIEEPAPRLTKPRVVLCLGVGLGFVLQTRLHVTDWQPSEFWGEVARSVGALAMMYFTIVKVKTFGGMFDETQPRMNWFDAAVMGFFCLTSLVFLVW